MLRNYDYVIDSTIRSIENDFVNYTLIFLLFFFIIIFVIVIIYYAKWLTLGPKLKRRFSKIFGKFKKKKSIDGVTVKGKDILIDSNYIEEIELKIKNAETPQELLDLQAQRDKHNKQVEFLEKQIKQKEEQKLEKIKMKEERSRISKEMKEQSSKLKKEQKEQKKQFSNKKKEDKKKENKKNG